MLKSFILFSAVVFVLLFIFLLIVAYRRRYPNLKTENFQKKWKELQKLLAHKETWDEAIIQADDLLDEALRKLHFKGKTMGERMVSAHKKFSDSDAAWFSHKLRKRLQADDPPTLKERDVKKALLGTGQALKDLGALK